MRIARGAVFGSCSNGLKAQEKGIVDRFCKQSRRYAPGQVDDEGTAQDSAPVGTAR